MRDDWRRKGVVVIVATNIGRWAQKVGGGENDCGSKGGGLMIVATKVGGRMIVAKNV